MLLLRPAADALRRLLQALDAGTRIVPVSGWRSPCRTGISLASSLRENGPAFTQTYVARPGCSEHETGLAIDLGENALSWILFAPPSPIPAYAERFGPGRRSLALFSAIPRARRPSLELVGSPGTFGMWASLLPARLQTAASTLEEYLL